MATVGERLAELVGLARDNRERINELHDEIHGGPSVAWAQSVMGRLHQMRSAIEAADKLADAAQALAAQQERTRQEAAKMSSSRLTRRQWYYLAGCATATAAAPYALLYLGH